MASRTQIRLEQLTGSLAQNVAAGASLSATSLKGVLDAVASGLHNITGQDFYNVSDSVLKDQNGQSRISYADGAGVIIGAEGDGSTALTIGSAAAGDKLVLFGGNAKLADAAYIGSTTTADLLTFNANSVQVKAAKDLLVDEILESTSAAGVTIDGVLLKDNDIVIPDGSTIGSTTTAEAITIAANGLVTLSGDLTVSGNDLDFAAGAANIGASVGANNLTLGGASSTVVVAGSLTVNGTTTTLDTTNLLVEDPIIVLNKNNSSANGQGGIAIEQGGSSTDMVFGRVANDTWGVGTKDTSGGTVTTVADMTLGAFRASTLEIESATDYIALSSGDLAVVSAGDLVLDADGADIFFDDAGTRFGGISMSAGNSMLILSSSAGNSISLLSQGGTIYLGNKDGSNAGSFDLSTTNEVKLLDATDRVRLTLDTASGDGVTTLSGSVKLNNGADPAQLVFLEASPNGTNTLTLDVPAAIGSSYTLTLPASNGTSGQVLKLSDGNGNLEFGDATGDLARFAYKATATIAAGNVDFGASKTAGISALPVGTADLNITKAAADLNNALEVYVNGQLLISGSSGGSDTDYTFVDSDTINFAFGLEADDIIQIIQR